MFSAGIAGLSYAEEGMVMLSRFNAIPERAWWGFASATDRQRVEAFLRRGARSGLYPSQLYTADEITDSADDKLSDCVLRNDDHVLHEL